MCETLFSRKKFYRRLYGTVGKCAIEDSTPRSPTVEDADFTLEIQLDSTSSKKKGQTVQILDFTRKTQIELGIKVRST